MHLHQYLQSYYLSFTPELLWKYLWVIIDYYWSSWGCIIIPAWSYELAHSKVSRASHFSSSTHETMNKGYSCILFDDIQVSGILRMYLLSILLYLLCADCGGLEPIKYRYGIAPFTTRSTPRNAPTYCSSAINRQFYSRQKYQPPKYISTSSSRSVYIRPNHFFAIMQSNSHYRLTPILRHAPRVHQHTTLFHVY